VAKSGECSDVGVLGIVARVTFLIRKREWGLGFLGPRESGSCLPL
jgi:hypothetical protein